MLKPSSPDSTDRPLGFDDVLREEKEFLGKDGDLSALCLSGGGVRSAAFNLGVLQWLARAGVLDNFDYISTVSGGGYIGGWLSAWRVRAARNGDPSPAEQMQNSVEPDPVSRLRDFIKYLDPHTGATSPDVWTLTATILRNLLVTWLVLIPVIALAVMLPDIYYGLLRLRGDTCVSDCLPPGVVWVLHWDAAAIVLLVIVAMTYAARQLPSLGGRTRGTPSFIAWFLVPILSAHLLLSLHRFWSVAAPQLDASNWYAVGVSTAAMVLPWIIGGWFSDRWWRPWTWTAAVASGFAGRLLADWLHRWLVIEAQTHPHHYAVYDLSLSELMLFVQLAAFVGLASRDMTDEDREWWARASAWVLLSGAVWLVAGAVTILGPVWVDDLMARFPQTKGYVHPALSVATALSGAGAYMLAAKQALGDSGWGKVRAILLALLAPLMVVMLLVLVSISDLAMLNYVHSWRIWRHGWHQPAANLLEDLILLGGLAVVAWVLSRFISVNEFSLHDMYRARLVRTFLGVSKPEKDRNPSRFTGFDAADDLPIKDLKEAGRPLHVVNATLNLVSEGSLATAEVKATSFTTTALHAGSGIAGKGVGYRPSSKYAGGVSLGRAIATSGAAVSPNMGTGSTPAMTFLLTVLNARLGVWLGNPGTPGEQTWTRGGPTVGVGTLLHDLLGRTTDNSPYVYLSDGGHFENLGLYAMIARGCRHIIVSDAGADPDYEFDDLANVVRRVHIDFGIVIEFANGVHIGRAGTGNARWALGRIRYAVNDPTQDGVLIYMKPAILGDEPVDVANYARTHPDFPQESTADQWFDEAQFDSYRELGFKTAASLIDVDPRDGHTFESVRRLFGALREQSEGREGVGAI